MTLIRWKPIRDIRTWEPVSDVTSEIFTMQKEIDRLFDRFRGGVSEETTDSVWTPAVDILEEKDQFIVRAELPGVEKKDVKITIQNNMLVLRGEKKFETEKEGRNFHRVERSYGSFYRSFTLPTSVVSSRIEASYTDGVLTVAIPKSEESKPKEIEVKVS
ncbi:MAG TPA: Hsp20/alpha crystallin family protein [Bacteroidota bacterium]|nr:Hsp20/alpha crystallin family protein [Bacteroidota bacterium]